jgi:hypothetical protein
MNRKNAETYKMLTRAADFATTNVGLFAKSSAGVEVQKSLKTAMEELTAASSSRVAAESALRSARNQRDTARDHMKGLLAKADQTARALHSHAFRSPARISDRSLIDAGVAFAAEIEAEKPQFIAYGFSPEDVTNAVKPLEAAVLAYSAARAKRSAAIREFDEKLDTAMECTRRFEAIVVNTFDPNGAAMAQWTNVRTVSKVPPRKRAEAAPKAA